MLNRYRRGQNELGKLDSSVPEYVESTLGSISPEFSQFFTEIIGDIYSRPHLSLQQRAIITLSVLVTRGQYNRIRSHVKALINTGMSRTEIIEIIFHMSVYVGFPKAINGLIELDKIMNSLEQER